MSEKNASHISWITKLMAAARVLALPNWPKEVEE